MHFGRLRTQFNHALIVGQRRSVGAHRVMDIAAQREHGGVGI